MAEQRQARVVFRAKKLKTWGAIGAAAAHNLRTRPTPNAAPKPGGFVVIKQFEHDSAVDAVRSTIGDQKIRSNAVLANEIICSASPTYFRPGQEDRAGYYEPKKLEAWRQAMEPWIAEQFPDAVSVVLHLDETTPHYQIIDVPLDETGKLNSRAKWNGPKGLAEWQTKAWKAVERLGIQRGIEGSLAEHTDIGVFYSDVVKPLPSIPEVKTPRPEPLAPRSMSEKMAFTEAKTKRDELEAEHAAQNAQRNAEKKAKQDAISQAWEQAQHKANGFELAEKKRLEAEATASKLDDEKRRLKVQADKLREMPLGDVLRRVYGAELEKGSKEKHASQKYVLPDGRQIAVSPGANGADVWVEQGDKGQRGAINLVMHLDGLDYKGAVRLLAESFDATAVAAEHSRATVARAPSYVAKIIAEPVPSPAPDPTRWPKVKRWLHEVRGIPKKLIDSLYEKGLVYADSRGNATFKRVNGGAFQRGTGDTKFHRSVGGAECGPFVVPGTGKTVVLCEGALDGIAVMATRPAATIIASGGDMLPPGSLKKWIPDESEILAAHDADNRGEAVAKIASETLGAKRLKPSEKDWSETVRREPWRIDATWIDTDTGTGEITPLKLPKPG